MKVLSTIAAFTASQYAIEVNQVEELLGGMMYGLIQKDDLSNIEKCLTDADQVVAEVNEAVADIMKEDISDILAGVEVLGKLAMELPDDFQNCEDMQADATKISNWVSSLIASPTKTAEMVATNAVTHFSAILADVNKSSSDIASNDYYTAGQDIADVVIQLLGAIPASGTVEEQPENIIFSLWWDVDSIDINSFE